jgi:hypothetical protein
MPRWSRRCGQLVVYLEVCVWFVGRACASPLGRLAGLSAIECALVIVAEGEESLILQPERAGEGNVAAVYPLEGQSALDLLQAPLERNVGPTSVAFELGKVRLGASQQPTEDRRADDAVPKKRSMIVALAPGIARRCTSSRTASRRPQR